MENFDWGIFILGVIAYQLIKMLALSFNQWVIERRQKRFLKLVHIHFPDHGLIVFRSMESTDKRSIQALEQQIEQAAQAEKDRIDEEQQDRRADRGRARDLRPEAPRRGEDASR
jgi:hypothetical protein